MRYSTRGDDAVGGSHSAGDSSSRILSARMRLWLVGGAVNGITFPHEPSGETARRFAPQQQTFASLAA